LSAIIGNPHTQALQWHTFQEDLLVRSKSKRTQQQEQRTWSQTKKRTVLPAVNSSLHQPLL
jgi:hypothetical protein